MTTSDEFFTTFMQNFKKYITNKGGRPKRNPIERIRIKIFIFAVCKVANIKLVGYQLEQHFEPNKIKRKKDNTLNRPCKWDKYVNGEHTPSLETLSLIFNKYPEHDHLKELFYSPLWDALAAGEHKSQYWLNIYQRLPLSLQQLLFKAKCVDGSPYQRKDITDIKVEAILKHWNLYALTCLIAIFRENNSLNGNTRSLIEEAIFQLLISVSPSLVEHQFIEELFLYIENHIIENQHYIIHYDDFSAPFDLIEKKYWHIPIKITQQRISHIKDILIRAEQVKLIYSEQSKKSFLFWRFTGDMEIIDTELIMLTSDPPNYKINNSILGLRWLIEKLYPERGPPKKFTSQ